MITKLKTLCPNDKIYTNWMTSFDFQASSLKTEPTMATYKLEISRLAYSFCQQLVGDQYGDARRIIEAQMKKAGCISASIISDITTAAKSLTELETSLTALESSSLQ